MTTTLTERNLSDVAPLILTHEEEATSPYAGLSGENLICFAKDWSEDPTSCNHVLKELAKRNRVVWLNSISTRAPSLSSGRDLRKIVRKLAAFAQGPKQVGEQMWVYTPSFCPGITNPLP